MAMSFNAARKMVDELISGGRLTKWQLDEAALESFFRIDKDDPERDRQRIDAEIKKLQPNSAEYYIGNLVVAGVANPPAKPGGGIVKEREFTSDEQKAHYELSRRALKEVKDFINGSKTCQALIGLQRDCLDKNGKVVKKSIEPMVHMRNTDAVLTSYEDAHSRPEDAGGAPTEPQPAPQPQPQ